MNTAVATAEKESAPPLPRLIPKNQQNLGDPFHCRHGVPEHHRCQKCEEESQLLPNFWD